jgi:tetratricopeptide (TPR) repeat protein
LRGVVVVEVALIAVAPAAAADPAPIGDLDVPASDAALARYRLGISLYTEGRFAEAAREFEVCAGMLPASAKLPYNAARSWERAGDVERAVRQYRRYLEVAPQAADRAEVEGAIAALEAQRAPAAATLVVDSTPVGADVFVDGAPEAAGQTPLRAPVPPGTHAVRVELPGYVTTARELTAAAGAEARAAFALERDAPPPPGPTWRRPAGWAAVGTAAAAVGVATWLGVGAASAWDDAKGTYGDSARHDRLRDDFETRRTGAVVAGALAVGLAVTGVSLLW